MILPNYCEAHGITTDKRCTREAKHWTHVFVGDGEPFPAGRLHVCEQHFKMAERYRRRGAQKMLMLWKALLEAPE